jgi:hypothetical protein
MATKTSDSVESVLWIAAGAALVYVAIKYILPTLQGVGTAASATGNAVASPIASLINWATGVSAPSVPANTAGRGVILPDGSVAPLSSFTSITPSSDLTSLYGVYQGTMYTISGPVDANGNYTAS